MKRKRPKNGKSKSVKRSLNSVLRTEYREVFPALVYNLCHSATIISVLASLLFLYKTNRAFDDDDQQFFYGNGIGTIKQCFNSVLNGKQHTLPFAFRQLVERVRGFDWPQLNGMGNAFNSLVDQYITNVKNNLKVPCYSRIKIFFTLQRYELNLVAGANTITEMDVKNATKSVMFNNVPTPTPNVQRLLQQAAMIGIPVGENFCDIVRARWFSTIPIFIQIQRMVYEHHERFELLNDAWRRYYRDRVNNPEPNIARPPRIQNFRVIPVHDFKMKHIRIDAHLFYFIACKLKALKLKVGVFNQKINISKEDYDDDLWRYWNCIFDMDKIEKVRNGMAFDYAIVTDSVAVSLSYLKREHPSREHTNEEIKRMYENNQFTFVLGMDPGVRTWCAAVRKHIQSGVEVC